MASRIKAARQERGWSQSRLIAEMEVAASRQGVTLPSRETLKSRVSRWENNHARPDDFYRQLLREALGLDDRELGYAETAPPDPGATAAEELASRINLATQADDTLLGALKHQTEAVRLQDRQYGAGSLLEQMRGHVENIETHLSHAVFESSRRPLAWHLADSAALTGWQALDLGAIAQAWRYFELAARAAQQAGDLALYAFARLEHARALADLGRPAEAATLAQEVWSRAHDQVLPSARCWMAAAGSRDARCRGRRAKRCLDAGACRVGRRFVWRGSCRRTWSSTPPTSTAGSDTLSRSWATRPPSGDFDARTSAWTLRSPALRRRSSSTWPAPYFAARSARRPLHWSPRESNSRGEWDPVASCSAPAGYASSCDASRWSTATRVAPSRIRRSLIIGISSAIGTHATS